MENNTNIEEKKQSKKVLILIVITIILLSLITSCSCTSKFLGKLGESLSDSIGNIFNNEGDHNIDDNVNDKEPILNQELKFDTNELEVSLAEKNAKITFTYKTINPERFTCSTSDSSIATCYVSDGYVVVNPKGVGQVTVTLQTVTNGKQYEATTKVVVTDQTRQIQLSTQGGTIDLRYGTQMSIPYSLVGIIGDITVSSSDPAIASASVNNGRLQIRAFRTGRVTITLSTVYSGVTYTTTFDLRVIRSEENNDPGNNETPGQTPGQEEPGATPDPEKPKYELSTYQTQYDMSFVNEQGERIVVFNTNLFTKRNVTVEQAENKKEIKVCSNDKNYCVNLTVDGNMDEANISLEYIGDTSEPNSLPFKVVAASSGTSIIHVKGMAEGKEIASFDVKIVVGKKYNVTIDANGGIFNELVARYEFQLGYDDELDLSKYDEPYKINQSECTYYSFLGYSKETNGQIEYNRTDKKILTKVNSDMTLYAVYTEQEKELEEQTQEKTLWAADIPLFHNEEYYEQHKEDKVIYPGAYGSYVMHIKNETENPVVLTGMTLKENTICIPGKGCLNMGYMVRYSPESKETTYYYGNTNEEYWILHSRNESEVLSENSFQTKIDFQDKKIELAKDQEIALTIFWRWEEINDQLDTLIGNQAASKLTDSSINDKYNLSVGIHFETPQICTK